MVNGIMVADLIHHPMGEVVFISEGSRPAAGNNDVCQLCSRNLQALGKRERDEHYEEHQMSTKKPPTTGKRKLPSRSSGPSPSKPRSYGMPCQRRHKEDQFWHPSHSDPPPTNYTPGILTILKGALKKSHAENNTARAVLCYERTTHISRELFDSGWGCGYRNFLMACAALMDQKIQPLYFCHLDAPLPPGVWNLQQWIEDAWKQGYDEIGAKELGHQLVGTKKFIGTGDIYVAFISRGISCRLVDFDLKRSTKGPRALTDWVVQYFSDPARKQGSVHDVLRNASPVVATDKMPVIFQYRGHSVTIIGFEVARSGEINLLVFDPSHIFAKKIRSAALTDPQNVTFTSSKLSKTLRVGQQKSRSRSKSPVSRKRTRLGPDSEGPIVISDSEDDEEGHDRASHCTLCAGDVIKIFRWKMSKLEKHKNIQLLYFPMSDPLTPEERRAHRVVTSDLVSS